MDQLSFTTKSRTAEAAFAAYHDLYAPVADATRLSDAFSVEVDASRIGPLILFDRKMRSVRHSRSQRRAIRNGFDHFTLQLALKGELRVSTENGDRVADAGELAIIDMDRSMMTEVDDANVLTMSVPRSVLDDCQAEPSRLHGAVFGNDQCALLRDFLRSYLRLPTDAHAGSERVGRVLGELIRLTIDTHAPAGDERREALDHVTRERARRFVNANLHADPATVASAIGRSRSALYRAFEPHGGVSNFILTRRLAALRRQLGSARENRTLAELSAACGFSSPSHCSRTFRLAYGLAPTEYRALRGANDAPTGGNGLDVANRLDRWWSEMR